MRFLLFSFLAMFALPIAASGSCEYSGCGDHEHHHHAGQVTKKKVIDLGAVMFVATTVGVGTYCAVRRFGYNDPCIGEPLKKTTKEDSFVTPQSVRQERIDLKVYQ